MRRGERLLLMAACALTGWLAVGALCDPVGWERRRRLQADLSALRGSNRAAEVRASGMRAAISALRSRPAVQERVIRHELGYLRPGEIVLRLDAAPR